MFVNHSLKIKIDLNLKNGPSFFFSFFFLSFAFQWQKMWQILKASNACLYPTGKKNQSRESNSNVAQCFRSQKQQQFVFSPIYVKFGGRAENVEACEAQTKGLSVLFSIFKVKCESSFFKKTVSIIKSKTLFMYVFTL